MVVVVVVGGIKVVFAGEIVVESVVEAGISVDSGGSSDVSGNVNEGMLGSVMTSGSSLSVSSVVDETRGVVGRFVGP